MSMSELQKQTNANIQAKANLIWEIATHLVGLFKPHEYGKVILPMTVLKRFDDALKPTKAAVVEMAKKLDAQHVEGAARDGILCRVAQYDFYNTSNYDFAKLIADPDNVESNFDAYLQGFSSNIKKNPYLSEEEAYRIGLNIKELFYKSFSELPKRVVIHKRTPFRREEVKGLVESLSSAGVKNIELLEITYEDNLKCFALNERCTQVDGYPVRRGMCFPIDKNTMYLFTHGIAPSVISPKRRYFQGGKSVPLPLKVVKHYGSGDMAQIATEILGLSKMNWNSFGLYSKLPCTIESSNEIARIGWLLSQFEGTLYDYRYFM